MGVRRKARETVLKVLYSLEFSTAKNIEEAMDRLNGMEPFAPKTRSFARELASGTFVHREEIDALLKKHAKNWTLDRMSCIDRNILRFSAYELIYRREIPVKVVINEALEIAKKYSISDSCRFINGILDVISKDSAARRGKSFTVCNLSTEEKDDQHKGGSPSGR